MDQVMVRFVFLYIFSTGRARGTRGMGKEEKTSRALSKLLRHSAEKRGIALDAAGYVRALSTIPSIPTIQIRCYHIQREIPF